MHIILNSIAIIPGPQFVVLVFFPHQMGTFPPNFVQLYLVQKCNGVTVHAHLWNPISLLRRIGLILIFYHKYYPYYITLSEWRIHNNFEILQY